MSDHEEFKFVVKPYMFEPPPRHAYQNRDSSEDSSSSSSDSSESEDQQIQRDVDNWCSCGNCVKEQVIRNRKCCKDYMQCVEKIGSNSCICEHESFIVNCLNPHVLEVLLYEYVDEEGPIGDKEPLHEIYRDMAYTRFRRLIWHTLGKKKKRKVIPSCVSKKIRESFTSSNYNYPIIP